MKHIYKKLCRLGDLYGPGEFTLPEGFDRDTETVFAIHRRSASYLPTVDIGGGEYDSYLPIAAVLKGAKLVVLSYFSAYGHVRAPLNLNPDTQIYYLAARQEELPKPVLRAEDPRSARPEIDSEGFLL